MTSSTARANARERLEAKKKYDDLMAKWEALYSEKTAKPRKDYLAFGGDDHLYNTFMQTKAVDEYQRKTGCSRLDAINYIMGLQRNFHYT